MMGFKNTVMLREVSCLALILGYVKGYIFVIRHS